MNDNNESASSEGVRLNRFLAQCGIGSRRKCDDLIATGHILLNGIKVTEMGVRINPEKDRVEYRGKAVKHISAKEYWAWFKPREVMVTGHDPQGRATVYSELEKTGREVRHLRYMGRLDYQSEGLLLLTNDGDLIHALTHPRFHIKKTYQVKLERRLTSEEIRQLLEGVTSEGQVLRAGAVRLLSLPDKGRVQYWYEIDLYEGKNRQLRRMFEVLRILVGRLRRTRFASVKLGTMTPGELRPLLPPEIAALKRMGYPR